MDMIEYKCNSLVYNKGNKLCGKDAMYILPGGNSYCEEHHQSNGYPNPFWGNNNVTTERIGINDIGKNTSVLAQCNIKAAKELPEKFRTLCNPIIAYRYATTVLQYDIEGVEDVLLSDINLALRIFPSLERLRWEGLEQRLIEEVREIKSSKDSYFLDLIPDLFVYMKACLDKDRDYESLFEEGREVLGVRPNIVFNLIQDHGEIRVPKEEYYMCGDIERGLEYMKTRDELRSLGEFPKLESVINWLYKKYYNEDKKGYNLEKIYSDFNVLEPNTPTTTFSEMRRKNWGSDLANSASRGAPSLGEYMYGKGVLWKEAEPLLTRLTSSVAFYCRDIKRDRIPSVETLYAVISTDVTPTLEYLELCKYPHINGFKELELKIIKVVRAEGEGPYRYVGLEDSVIIVLERMFQLEKEGHLQVSNELMEVVKKVAPMAYSYSKVYKRPYKEGEVSIFQDRHIRELYIELLKSFKTEN